MINRILYEDKYVVKVQVYNEDIYILCLDGLYKMGRNSQEIELICDIPEKYSDRRENNICFKIFRGLGLILSLNSAYLFLIKLNTKQTKEICIDSSPIDYERGFFLEDYDRIFIIKLYSLDVYFIDDEEMTIRKEFSACSQMKSYLFQNGMDFIKVKYGDAWIQDDAMIFNVVTRQKDLFWVMDLKTKKSKEVIDIAGNSKQYGLARFGGGIYTQLVDGNHNEIVEFDINSMKRVRNWDIEPITRSRVFLFAYKGLIFVLTLEGDIFRLSNTSDTISTVWDGKGSIQQFDSASRNGKVVVLNKDVIQIDVTNKVIRRNLGNIELLSYIRYLEKSNGKNGNNICYKNI